MYIKLTGLLHVLLCGGPRVRALVAIRTCAADKLHSGSEQWHPE
jgi:hypothetical protein